MEWIETDDEAVREAASRHELPLRDQQDSPRSCKHTARAKHGVRVLNDENGD